MIVRLVLPVLAALAFAGACGEAAKTAEDAANEIGGAAVDAEAAAAFAESQRLKEAKVAFQAAVAFGDDGRLFDLADTGNPYALFYRAEKRLAADNEYEKQAGFEDAEAAAEAGSPDAQLWVGYRMAMGTNGYPWKPNSGILMVERAAKQGHAEAMYTLGQLYEQGGPMHDLKKAREWYQKAVDGGHMAARDSVAQMDREAGE